MSAIEGKLREVEEQIDAAESKIANLEKQRADNETQQQEIAREILRQQKKMEKSIQKKALLTAKAADCAKNIRDLGVLPEEAFDKYERLESKSVSLFTWPSNKQLKLTIIRLRRA